MKSTPSKTLMIKSFLEKAERGSEYLDKKLEGQIRRSIQSFGKGPLSVNFVYRIGQHAKAYEVKLQNGTSIHISYNNRSKRIIQLPSVFFEN